MPSCWTEAAGTLLSHHQRRHLLFLCPFAFRPHRPFVVGTNWMESKRTAAPADERGRSWKGRGMGDECQNIFIVPPPLIRHGGSKIRGTGDGTFVVAVLALAVVRSSPLVGPSSLLLFLCR